MATCRLYQGPSPAASLWRVFLAMRAHFSFINLPKIGLYGNIFPTMATNVEIVKTGNEHNGSILRRFTKKIQRSGLVQSVRGRRYAQRKPSDFTKKKGALKMIERRNEIKKMIKLGKLAEKTPRK